MLCAKFVCRVDVAKGMHFVGVSAALVPLVMFNNVMQVLYALLVAVSMLMLLRPRKMLGTALVWCCQYRTIPNVYIFVRASKSSICARDVTYASCTPLNRFAYTLHTLHSCAAIAMLCANCCSTEFTQLCHAPFSASCRTSTSRVLL